MLLISITETAISLQVFQLPQCWELFPERIYVTVLNYVKRLTVIRHSLGILKFTMIRRITIRVVGELHAYTNSIAAVPRLLVPTLASNRGDATYRDFAATFAHWGFKATTSQASSILRWMATSSGMNFRQWAVKNSLDLLIRYLSNRQCKACSSFE